MFWVGVGLLCVSACKKKNSEDPPVPIDEAAIRLNGDWYLPEAGGYASRWGRPFPELS